MKIAVLCDFEEEGWPSMDLVGRRLTEALAAGMPEGWSVERICPPMVRRFSRKDAGRSRVERMRFNIDRLLNRMWDYPRLARSLAGDYDIFHVVDHSYAQLVHALPADRTLVTCHDLDTFRCVLEPGRDPRPWPFRRMTEVILDGLRKAARVLCDSRATYEEVLAHGLVPAERAEIVPIGMEPACSPMPDEHFDREAAALLGDWQGIDLLHVGSTIPRKRVEDLLRIVASVFDRRQDIRLIRVGGALTDAQAKLAAELGIQDRIITLPRIGAETLSAVYRRATLVLQPSSAEGFGLPVVEALGCGTPVVASDLAVLREVGGAATTYRPVGDIDSWADAVLGLLTERDECPAVWEERRSDGLAHAGHFRWSETARTVMDAYQEVLSRGPLNVLDSPDRIT